MNKRDIIMLGAGAALGAGVAKRKKSPAIGAVKAKRKVFKFRKVIQITVTTDPTWGGVFASADTVEKQKALAKKIAEDVASRVEDDRSIWSIELVK